MGVCAGVEDERWSGGELVERGASRLCALGAWSPRRLHNTLVFESKTPYCKDRRKRRIQRKSAIFRGIYITRGGRFNNAVAGLGIWGAPKNKLCIHRTSKKRQIIQQMYLRSLYYVQQILERKGYERDEVSAGIWRGRSGERGVGKKWAWREVSAATKKPGGDKKRHHFCELESRSRCMA